MAAGAGKGKKRVRHQNPEPFIKDEDSAASTRRSKSAKVHQQQDKLISSGMSSKILKEALIQQNEIENEAAEEQNPNNSLLAVVEEEPLKDEDIDDFAGFNETQSQLGYDEEAIDEDDERLLESFFSNNVRQLTLSDYIARKTREKDASLPSANFIDFPFSMSAPKMDNSIKDLYKGVGQLLHTYTAGKMPKAFKHIPSMEYWEDVLYLTEPEKWSPNAMYQATRMFASRMGIKKAERFYKLVLLPRIRDDIKKNKKLHFALYQSLKKSLYKPAAFNKGILFPLCESGTCSLREAVIVGSVIHKVSIPHLHSSVALLKLTEMQYCGTTSYFIKLLFEKKYALPFRVIDAAVDHFMKFIDDSRIMPVIWHQSLLAFVQRYKNVLRREDKDDLRKLVQEQKHSLVTPEICRELDSSSLNRGEKADDLMLISAPSVINKTIEEDRFDIPEVPMEED